MRRSLKIGMVLVVALMALLAVTPVVSAAPSPFTGVWWSIDTVDNSYQQMAIGGGPGNTHHVAYRDDVASLFEGSPVAMAKGTLQAEGNKLSGYLPVWSLSKPKMYEDEFEFLFVYQEDDTLADGWGGTWYRK